MRIFKKQIFGVTLLSLLIGIALGTFLIAVMLQIFTATRANYQLAKNLQELDNVARYASLIMTDIVSQAGYRNPNATTGVLPSYSTTFVPFTTTLYGPNGSTYNTGTYPNSDDPAGVVLSYFPGENVFISAVDPNDLDKLWVKFQGEASGAIRDCNDLYGNTSTVIKIRFYSRTSSVGDGEEQTGYYCERQNNNTTYTYSDQPTGTEIIPPGVFDQAFVRFGEDIVGGGFINRYIIGSQVANRNRVYSVRVAFLLHTRDEVRSEPVTQSFLVFGDTVSFTDRRIHKLYMFTIPLPYAQNYDLTFGTP